MVLEEKLSSKAMFVLSHTATSPKLVARKLAFHFGRR